MSAEMVKCAECLAWENSANDMGKCMLNPPFAILAQSQHPMTGQVMPIVLTFHPETKPTDYCFKGVRAETLKLVS
jgi:hypothetical protein